MNDVGEWYEAEEAAPEWNVRNLANAYAPRPPTEYVVDKFFERGSLNIVYGAPASMKSMLMADCAACVVAGLDWLPGCFGAGGKGVETAAGPVLWVDMDNGRRRTDERIEAVSRARDLDTDAPFYYVSMPEPPLHLSGEEAGGAISLLMRTVHSLQARMVVIDNLGLITGEVEENSAMMATVMNRLRKLAEWTNAAVVVIHHQRKGASNGGRAGDSLRGHSSIEAAVDLALLIMRNPDGDDLLIKDTKTRGVPVPRVGATFNFEHRLGTHDLERAWFSGAIGAVSDEDAIRDMTIAVLRAEGKPITKTLLIDRVKEDVRLAGGAVSRVRGIVLDMLAQPDGRIIERQDGKSKLVSLT